MTRISHALIAAEQEAAKAKVVASTEDLAHLRSLQAKAEEAVANATSAVESASQLHWHRLVEKQTQFAIDPSCFTGGKLRLFEADCGQKTLCSFLHLRDTDERLEDCLVALQVQCLRQP